MKQLFILTVSFVVFSNCNTGLFAQVNSTKTDTIKQRAVVTDSLAYIREIIRNKQKYINQPLSVLINDLRVPVKSYNLSQSSGNRFLSTMLIISFDEDSIRYLKMARYQGYRDPLDIVILWITPLLRADIDSHLKRAGGEWTEEEQHFYSNKIVGDVKTDFLNK